MWIRIIIYLMNTIRIPDSINEQVVLSLCINLNAERQCTFYCVIVFPTKQGKIIWIKCSNNVIIHIVCSNYIDFCKRHPDLQRRNSIKSFVLYIKK